MKAVLAVLLVVCAAIAVQASAMDKIARIATTIQSAKSSQQMNAYMTALAEEYAKDAEWVKFRDFVVRDTNERVKKAVAEGHLDMNAKAEKCLAKDKSLRIAPSELAIGGKTIFEAGSGDHEGYLAEVKAENVGWDGTFTIPFSIGGSASFFIGVEAKVALNIESYNSGQFIIRPCIGGGITLGLDVGAGGKFGFGLIFGDSEYGQSANLNLGGTVSAGIGLSMTVALRVGPSDKAKEAALKKEAADADAAGKTAEGAKAGTDDAVNKKESAGVLKRLWGWVKTNIPQSAIVGLLFSVDVGAKIEAGKFEVPGGALKDIASGFIGGLFDKLKGKLQDYCKGKKCETVAKLLSY